MLEVLGLGVKPESVTEDTEDLFDVPLVHDTHVHVGQPTDSYISSGMSRPLHMRHNFPAAEALEAGGIDPSAVAELAPGVDPERLLIREARPWFERTTLRHASAIALPYVVYMRSSVFTRPRADLTALVIHEMVHVSQWRTEGYTRFLVRYLSDYLQGRLGGRSHADAYRAIRYEVDARDRTDRLLSR